MKTKLTILALLLSGVSMQATIINLDLGSPRVVTDGIYVTSDALNSTLMAGQTLNIDYEFNHPIKTLTKWYYVAIRALTNRVPVPDGLYAQVTQVAGYLVRPDGSTGPILCLGELGIYNPTSSDVLFGLANLYDGGPPKATDIFSGMHFDITLPDLPGVEINGLRLNFDPGARGKNNVNKWVVLAQAVPESGSTLLLFAISFALATIFYPYKIRMR